MLKNFFIIDAYGFLFRAFYALPPLRTKDGLHVGAIYGFLNMLLKCFIDNKYSLDYVVIACDSGTTTFRHDLYEKYKLNRDTPPDTLINQFDILFEALQALDLPYIVAPGFEADDIIATCVKLSLKEDGINPIVVSSDKDLMQLISDNVMMFDPIKDKFIKADDVVEKFGICPNQVVDFLSLTGDSSDNIPGVFGIGAKTAAVLINEFDTLDNLLMNLDKLKKSKRKDQLIENRENAILSRKLVLLYDSVFEELSFDQFKLPKLQEKKVAEFFI